MIPNDASPAQVTLSCTLQARVDTLAAEDLCNPELLGPEAGQHSIAQKEKARTALLCEAHEAWREFQETGEYLAWEDTRPWMESWGTDHELPAPPCRVFSKP